MSDYMVIYVLQTDGPSRRLCN